MAKQKKTDLVDTKTAQARLTEEAGRPVLEISVPYGTTVKQSQRVIAQLDTMIEKLTGCPCLSGLDIRFRDHTMIDLQRKFNERISLRPG